MSAFLNHQLTNVGWDALSTALGGGRLTFFKLQAGSGTIANDAVIPGMTGLVTPVYDLAITSYVIEGDGQITLFGNIESELVDSGFTFKELGVFATIEPPVMGHGGTPGGAGIEVIVNTPETRTNPIIPNPALGTPIMYSYCNSYAASDYIPGKNESTNVVNTIQVTIKIDDVVPTIVITPGVSGFAVTNIGAPTVGPGVWSYTTANIAYLKRLVAGAGMTLSEDANTITIAAKQLTNDLDLYVANGNPDIPPNFSTIQNAINYLGGFLIPTIYKARIHVSTGFYSMSGVVGQPTGWQMHTDLNHAQGQQITIQGPQHTTQTGTGLGSITGSAFNWSVVINGIGDTSQFVVNAYCIIDSATRSGSQLHGLIHGFFLVTAKTASSVTIKVPYWDTSFSLTGVSNIKITPITAILTPGQNVQGFHIGPPGIGLLQYIGVVGQNSTKRNYGFVLEGDSLLVYCGATGYNSVYSDNTKDNLEGGFTALFGATGTMKCCAATRNQAGIDCAANGGWVLTRCIATHNNAIGMWFDGGGSTHIWEGFSVIAGNGGDGLVVNAGMTCLINHSKPNGSLYVQMNDGDGIRVTGSSMFGIYNGEAARMDINSGYDVSAYNLGLFYGQTYVTGDRSFNIAVGNISTSGGLIV